MHRPAAQRTKALLKRSTIIAATAALVAGVGITVEPSPAANAVPPAAEQDWAELSAKLAGITGHWDTEGYTDSVTDSMPSTAILGNGDVGVTSSGSQGVKTFILSKGDFWNGGGTVRPAGLGGYTIKAAGPGEGNLALGRPVEVSSGTNSSPRAVSGAWDQGYEGWVSEVGKPQWIRVDLGADSTVGEFILKHDCAARGSVQGPNTPKDFTVQVSSADSPSSAESSTDWTTIATFTGNPATACITDVNLATPVSARYLRVWYTTPTQESTADSTNNPRARLGQIEVYAEAGGATPPPAPPFGETQNILDPSIDTEMQFDGHEVTMHTWQSWDENIVVTELTSASQDPVDLELSTWAGAGNAAGWYTETSGVDNGTLWAARALDSAFSANHWTTRGALATKVIGATLGSTGTSTSTSSATASGVFTLEPGSTVYIVTGVGGGGKGATTSTQDAITQAQDLMSPQTSVTLGDLAEAKATHWKDYWLQSWVDLNDSLLERYYYGAQYVVGSSARPGHLAPGLYGIWTTTDTPLFNGDYHMNYNFVAPWYGVYSSNRPELSLPLYDLVMDYLPQAEANAANDLEYINADYLATRPDLAGGADGALYPIGLGPWGTRAGGQSATIHNGYLQQTVGGLFNAVMFIEYWDYTHDEDFLRDYAFPYLRQMALFFEDWLDDGGDPSAQLNLWGGPHEYTWGRNSSPDVPFLRATLQTLIDTAGITDPDAGELATWEDMLDRLAPTPTITRNGVQVYALADDGTFTNEGGNPATPFRPGDNTVNLEVIQPAGEVDMFSDPALVTQAQNTITQMDSWEQINAFAKVFNQAARVRYPAATIVAELKDRLTAQLQPNLWPRDGYHGWEKAAATQALNFMLLYGNGDKLEVFPDWLAGQDASFHRLRAQGAFVVSADRVGGEVQNLTITSEAGADLGLVNPFGTTAVAVRDSSGDFVDYTIDDGVIRFATTLGETYSFQPVAALNSVTSPSVAGTGVVGQTLTATPGDWNIDGLHFDYQWQRDGIDISGAEASSYALVAADYGTEVSVVVTASRSGFTDVDASSSGLGPIGELETPVTTVAVSPAAAASGWHTSATQVTVSATDGISGVATIEYRVDGGTWQSYSAPFALAEGTHLVEARAADNAGNSSTTASETVRVDSVAPVASSIVDDDRVLTVTATDSASGVSLIEYSIDGGSWSTYSGAIHLGDDFTVIEVRATDNAGNQSAVVTTEVAGGSLSTAAAEVGTTVTVTGKGFDPGEQVDAEFQSTPVPLTTVTADGDGEVHFSFIVPAGASLGLHHVVLTGADSGTSFGLAIVVLPSAADLAFTGAGFAGAGILLSLAFVGFGMLLMSVRRRGEAKV